MTTTGQRKVEYGRDGVVYMFDDGVFHGFMRYVNALSRHGWMYPIIVAEGWKRDGFVLAHAKGQPPIVYANMEGVETVIGG